MLKVGEQSNDLTNPGDNLLAQSFGILKENSSNESYSVDNEMDLVEN